MTFNVDEFLASDVDTKSKSGDFDVDAFLAEPSESEIKEQKTKEAIKQDPSVLQTIDAWAKENPILQGLAEFQSGVNASAVDLVDFFTTDQINSILEISGSESRVPTLGGALEGSPEVEGGFMDDGLAKDIVRGSGEILPAAVGMGGAMRQGARALPAASQGEGALAGTVRELGKTTAGQDVGFGIASAAGAEFGEQYGGKEGALLGALIAPMAAGGATGLAKQGSKAVKNTVDDVMSSISKMSDDKASDMLAEQMVRSGMDADEVAAKLAQLGDEGMLADVNENFARLMKTAVNKIPAIQGKAQKITTARQKARNPRIMSAYEDATGTSSLSAKDEIKRLDDTLGKDASKLYDDARASTMKLSDDLQGMLNDTGSSLGKARVKAEQRLADEVAITGKANTQIDIIDATKRELDAQVGKAIREGDSGTVRTLTLLKKKMLKEADETIPAYKQARETFAGKAEMENAADMGRDFLKMKRRDMEDYFETLSPDELRMFQLGAKDAIIDKLDSTQLTSDVTKQMFGKGGDVDKLKMLFNDEADFKKFHDVLEKEANFVYTRQKAFGGSDSVKNANDQGLFGLASEVFDLIMGSPAQLARFSSSLLKGVSQKKGTNAHKGALEKVGDILLEANMKPDRVVSILKKGNRAEIKNSLDKAFKRIKARENKLAASASKTSVAGAAVTEDNNNGK